MKDQNENTQMQREFIENVHQELKDLDFSYKRWLNDKIHHAHAANEQTKHLRILQKIKGTEDIDLREMAITLYNLHVLNHGGNLEIDWETF
jgi:hypothetical protein